MPLNKVHYVDNETVITAKNLNEIQDAIIAALPTGTASGNPASFSDGAGGMQMNVSVSMLPKQSGSGDPSPTNVRPITGFTGITIRNSESASVVNLFEPLSGTVNGITFTPGSDGTIHIGGTYTATTWTYVTNSISPLSDLGLAAGDSVTVYSSLRAVVEWYPATGTSRLSYTQSNGAFTNATIPANAVRYRLMVYASRALPTAGASVDETVSCLFAKGTASEFVPYADEYVVEFPAAAGTVYGGTLDLATGELTVEKFSKTWAWSEGVAEYAPSGNSFERRTFSLAVAALAGAAYSITNCIAAYNTGTPTTAPYFYLHQNGLYFYAWLPTDTDSNFEIQLCGTLSEPVTYQLTSTQVVALAGENNLSAGEGATVSVEYSIDLKSYIDQRIADVQTIIAYVESDFTASRNYTAKQFIIIGDTLYRATANIASGGTITPGTNVTETTVGAQITSLI